MKRISIFIFFTVLMLHQGYATGKLDSTIVGQVLCNGKAAPFVNVSIDGTTLGTLCNAKGEFKLQNIPEGTYTVRVSGVGYTTSTKVVKVESAEVKTLLFNVQEDVLNLSEIIVSADRNQSNRMEAPVVITTLSPKLLELTQSVNLAEGLCFSPGLRTETNCQNCGFSQLRMNGMEGHYTQILLNSRPVFSGLAGVYGLEMIPSSMIERLEIIRGGGSSLFGGSAIAGTVNIITKETHKNSLTIDNRFGVIGLGMENAGPAATDEQLSVNASVISDNGKTGGYIYTMLRNRQAFDANDDDFTELVKMKNTTFGFNVFHKPSTKSKLSLDAYRIDEFRRGGNKLDYLPHETDIAEQLNHVITGGNLTYNLFTGKKNNKLTTYVSAQNVERDSYYGAEQDPNAYGQTSNITSSLGAQYAIHSTNFIFPTSSTIIGIDNSNDYIKDSKLGSQNSKNTTITKQYVNTLGTFIQQDWTSDKLNLSMGLRYDTYFVKDKQNDNEELSNGVLVPRINALYKITPNMRLRMGYAKGYRAPQVFNEDLHIELVNAVRVQTINDPNLKQETSHAFTASFNSDFKIGHSPCFALLEGFYTQLVDPFSDEYFDPNNDGNFVYKRVNAKDGAYVAGVNFEFKSYLTRKLETQIGFTIQKSQFDEEQAWGEDSTSVSKNFMRTPDAYGYATFIWSPTHRFSTNLSLNHTGSMYVPHFGLSREDYDQAIADGKIQEGDVIVGERLEKSDDFISVDIQSSYKFKLANNHQTELQIYIGIKNIFNQYQKEFDKGVYRDAGYVYGPRQPRTFNVGVKLNVL